MTGGIVLGIHQMMDRRIVWMNLLRTQQRMELIQQRTQNAGRAYSTMVNTAKLNPGSNLSQCFLNKSCTHDTIAVPMNLVDGLNRPISGMFDLSGRPCTKACPIEITTKVAIHCENQMSCSSPSEVITSFRIHKTSDAKALREFEDIEDSVTLSLFACPKGEYIRAVTDEGMFQCSAPEASIHGTTCPPKTAAYGLDKNGFLQCRPVINYCQRPLGLASVLDVSSSMRNHNKIGEAKQVLAQLVGKLDASRDSGSYTRFSTLAEIRAPLSNSFGGIQSIILGETTNGGTNLSAGLVTAASTLANYSQGEKLLLIVSDGFHNVGQISPVSVATQLKQNGYRIFTIGLSKAADKATLRQIASPGDFFNADDSGELQAAFAKISQMTCR